MDRVTESFLKKFAKEFSFENEKDKTVIFEHFVNYTLIEYKTDFTFNPENINIGIDGTIGIDGFALLLNRQLIYTEDELEEYLNESGKCSAEVIFIQSKTSSKFESKEIENFSSAVEDFVAQKQRFNWSDIALEKIKLFNKLIERSVDLNNSSPQCTLYYVSLGRDEKDHNNYAKIDIAKKRILDENVFTKLEFYLNDAKTIQSKYKKIGETLSKSFEFPIRATFPIINNVEVAYIGVIDAKNIIKLMTDENNHLLENVFYDNVRDFQGIKNKVNQEISATIQSQEKDSFAILNNGITIVAEELDPKRDIFTISNYQIINGCQTSHVIFENQEFIDEKIQIPLKLIISKDEVLGYPNKITKHFNPCTLT